ncbi:MAG TPA: M23 family metallopeptidase [Actinomycetota bacterium]|nr:M23 family metallopeptidase [Actinomycetota bacterium]
MRRLTALLAILGLAAQGSPARPATPAQQAALVPPPAYYRPVMLDGMTFPVARSNWFSVIEFDNDWHEPRLRLIGGKWRQVGVHEGTDISAEKGTPVLSASEGRVEAMGWTFYSGDRVGIRGVDGNYYFYAHLSAFAPGIAVGAPVRPGTVLGLVGNTGYGDSGHEDEFPPHLHFGIQASDWINPYPLLVRLYRRSASVTEARERRLARLADGGRGRAFAGLMEELYADFPAFGEYP